MTNPVSQGTTLNYLTMDTSSNIFAVGSDGTIINNAKQPANADLTGCFLYGRRAKASPRWGEVGEGELVQLLCPSKRQGKSPPPLNRTFR